MSLSPFRRVTRPGREANDDPEALAALREILVAPEQHEIDEIKRKLDEAQVTSRAVSDVLADAVRLSTTEGDDDLARALAPTIEESIEVSVRRNPKPLIAAISPVIGPSIRKSIAETFRGLLQSLNHSLEQSLSIQGLRWRIEAWRTGRPFAEVVLLHSLRYRVEQVFLIHKETGLLLEHVALDEEESENSDLVSGMLTAIQDFVRDSFGGESGDALESLRVGDRTVWIEEGSYAILAAVIRGNAPETLRGTLRATLDSVHRLLPEDLAHVGIVP